MGNRSHSPKSALLEQRETLEYVERIYAYGPSKVIERVSTSEVGDDYEALEDIILVDSTGKTFSVYDIDAVAALPKLRFAIERNDVTREITQAEFDSSKNLITIPKLAFRTHRVETDGLAPFDQAYFQELWGFPGSWSVLLHEVGHGHFAHAFPKEHARIGEYHKRLEAYKECIALGEIEEVTWNWIPYVENIIQGERYAWAFALRVLRRYREYGIDFEPEFTSRGQIVQFVHTRLANYCIEMLMLSEDDVSLKRFVRHVNRALRSNFAEYEHGSAEMRRGEKRLLRLQKSNHRMSRTRHIEDDS